LAKRNLDLGRERNRVACRLHALLYELEAGGIGRDLTEHASSFNPGTTEVDTRRVSKGVTSTAPGT